jgi:hypothetical protein
LSGSPSCVSVAPRAVDRRESAVGRTLLSQTFVIFMRGVVWLRLRKRTDEHIAPKVPR